MFLVGYEYDPGDLGVLFVHPFVALYHAVIAAWSHLARAGCSAPTARSWSCCATSNDHQIAGRHSQAEPALRSHCDHDSDLSSTSLGEPSSKRSQLVVNDAAGVRCAPRQRHLGARSSASRCPRHQRQMGVPPKVQGGRQLRPLQGTMGGTWFHTASRHRLW